MAGPPTSVNRDAETVRRNGPFRDVMAGPLTLAKVHPVTLRGCAPPVAIALPTLVNVHWEISVAPPLYTVIAVSWPAKVQSVTSGPSSLGPTMSGPSK